MADFAFPLCCHPTTAVLVSKDRFALEKLSKLINKEKIVVKHFCDPEQALDYINSLYLIPFSQRCMHNLDEDLPQRHSLGVNLLQISQEMYEANRYAQLCSVIVKGNFVDFNAFDFCEKIENRYIKKTVLGSTIDITTITSAFNKGIIDKYLNDAEADFQIQLQTALEEQKLSYFMQNSKLIFSTIEAQADFAKSLFALENFAKQFKDLLHEHNIIEYFLKAINGTYYFMNFQGDLFELNAESNTPNKLTLTPIDKADFNKHIMNLKEYYQKHPIESVY